MLMSMRKHAKFFYFLFIIVILSFIFWGVGTVDKSSTVSVAEIGKDRITNEEFWRAYERVRDVYREIYKGKPLDVEMEKKLNLKETVLNNLIEERVLLISAKKLGINVTDGELQAVITSDPRFMRDGIFRRDVYFRTLELSRLTPEMYEASLGRQLLLSKMKNLIWSAVDSTSLDTQGITADGGRNEEISKLILSGKRDAAVKSYSDWVRRQINVKVNKDIIS